MQDNREGRFTVAVASDDTVSLTLGHAFTEDDIDALVAAENALHAALPALRDRKAS